MTSKRCTNVYAFFNRVKDYLKVPVSVILIFGGLVTTVTDLLVTGILVQGQNWNEGCS